MPAETIKKEQGVNHWMKSIIRWADLFNPTFVPPNSTLPVPTTKVKTFRVLLSRALMQALFKEKLQLSTSVWRKASVLDSWKDLKQQPTLK
jgi:hypothetical protein